MIAPVGIRRLFTGGGDWRTLPAWAKSVVWTASLGLSVGVGGSAFVIDGDLLCLCIYEAAECERGSCGRPVTGERGPSSLIEDDRLMFGLADLEEAGECCEGGV